MEKNIERSDVTERNYPSYIVVTPAFNEEENIETTINSMIEQVVKPGLWVIVDDGSTDKTRDIIAAKTSAYSWIKVHHRLKKQNPDTDGLLLASEAEAFLEGLKIALDTCTNPDFVVKLDADLKFGADYFISLFNEFEHNPRLGIGGGTIFEYRNLDLVREKVNYNHVRGATKVYSYHCYKDIGGLRPVFGWDVIDEMLALRAGWEVASFKHIPLTHLRRTASRRGRFAGWARNGYMAYYIGMSPLRILLRVCFRLVFAGDIVQAGGLAYGYFGSFFRGKKKLDDAPLRKLVREYQWLTVRANMRG